MGMEEDMQALCTANEFMNHNHIKLKELSEGRAVMELTVVKESLNPYGIVHGGALYTMGDCASGIAARSDGRRYVTLSSSLNFLRSGKEGDTIQACILFHRSSVFHSISGIHRVFLSANRKPHFFPRSQAASDPVSSPRNTGYRTFLFLPETGTLLAALPVSSPDVRFRQQLPAIHPHTGTT